jgi:serine/threonine protein kinase
VGCVPRPCRQTPGSRANLGGQATRRGSVVLLCLEVALEYAPRGTLLDNLRNDPSDIAQSLVERVRLGAQITSALDHLHALGIIHCDIKLPSILVDAAGNALVADFGAALVCETEMSIVPARSQLPLTDSCPGGMHVHASYMLHLAACRSSINCLTSS